MLDKLDRDARLRLMKFVCSFAWADLTMADQEKCFIHRMIKKLKLDEEEAEQVAQWIQLPPRAEEVDPNEIPREHRRLFLEVARDTVNADGDVTDEERENLALLEQLIT